jgi:hypothetical protein
MKKLIMWMLILFVSAANASDTDGDTNNDGILSGEEQYFFEHPSVNASDGEIKNAIEQAKMEQEMAVRQEESERVQIAASNRQTVDTPQSNSAERENLLRTINRPVTGMADALDKKYATRALETLNGTGSSSRNAMEDRINGQNAQMNAQLQRQQAEQQRLSDQLRRLNR